MSHWVSFMGGGFVWVLLCLFHRFYGSPIGVFFSADFFWVCSCLLLWGF